MEFGENSAIYLQIADRLCENILLGKWQANERIPSVRELAVSIEVNPNTIMRTYTYLEEKGIIFNKRGIGFFIADNGFEKTKALRKENFINNELPKFFKEMDLLNLNIDNLNEYYKLYANNKNKPV